jgi:hypothetical protein
MEGHTAFKLRDYFLNDPFYDIYEKRNQDDAFFHTYLDYRKYLQSLHIIWQRIKEECNRTGDYHTQEFNKPFESPLSQETLSLITRKQATLNVVELDFETFIVLGRRFMDKVGLLVEKLIEIPKGKVPGNSFTKHKKFFIEHPEIQPNYTKFLENKIYWYEQELLLLRDKIFSHGKTMVTSMAVSFREGVMFTPMDRFGPLSADHKKIFLPMKSKYEGLYPTLKVTDNDYEMLNDFYQQIRRERIKLEKKDLDDLGDIVSSSGGIRVTEEFLECMANHLEDFTKEVIVILSAVK